MYREPGEQPEDPRDDLDDMAREGQLRRMADKARQQEAADKAKLEEEAKRNKEEMAREKAKLWRGLQRVSPAFSKLVSISFWGWALCLFAVSGVGGIMLEERQTTTPLLVSLVVSALVAPSLWIALVTKRRSVIQEQERWAKEKGYGMTNHLLAIGHSADANGELHLIVKLEQRVPKAQVTLFNDAIGAISPRSSVESRGKHFVIHSGTLHVDDLGQWCRNVAERFLPKLEDQGIRSVILRPSMDGLKLSEPD